MENRAFQEEERVVMPPKREGKEDTGKAAPRGVHEKKNLLKDEKRHGFDEEKSSQPSEQTN